MRKLHVCFFRDSHCEKAMSMVFIHVHIHHLQQVLHFLEVHPAIIVLVRLLEPVADPSESDT